MTDRNQDENNAAIVASIERALAAHFGLSAEEHYSHHEFIRAQLKREQDRAEMLYRLRDSTLGWIVIAVFTGVGATVWYAITHWIGSQNSGGQ